jgi:IS30 family transposase
LGYQWLNQAIFTKKIDFTQISKEKIVTIQEKLNHRPRKVLNYRTSYEVFFEEFAKEVAA